MCTIPPGGLNKYTSMQLNSEYYLFFFVNMMQLELKFPAAEVMQTHLIR